MCASAATRRTVLDVWGPRARRRLAPKTWERDSTVYEKHIRPVLGDRPIGALDVEDLVEWQDGLERQGVGAPTVIKAMSILSSVFDEHVFRTVAGMHWVETDWRNYRSRHFVPALERVEAEWPEWRAALARPDDVRESIAGLATTRPYDLGRPTHSALMLASGMSLQRLARIQGHGIRVLDESYSEQLAEFEGRRERIDPVREIREARKLIWTSPRHDAFSARAPLTA